MSSIDTTDETWVEFLRPAGRPRGVLDPPDPVRYEPTRADVAINVVTWLVVIPASFGLTVWGLWAAWKAVVG